MAALEGDDNGDESAGLDEALVSYDASNEFTPGKYEERNYLRDDQIGASVCYFGASTGQLNFATFDQQGNGVGSVSLAFSQALTTAPAGPTTYAWFGRAGPYRIILLLFDYLPRLVPFSTAARMDTSYPSALPDDETARLVALRSFQVLAALAEPVFEEFVALAARLFQVPISLLSVVEETDVYYPATVGVPAYSRVPRAEVLCSTAITQGRAVVYHDVLLEQHPPIPAEVLRMAEQNHVRFYAGALLRLPDQHPLGTLCLVNHEPRPFTPDEQRILELLAGLVSQTLAVRHRCRARPGNAGLAQWAHLSAELQEEIGALNALVRYLNARNGSLVPVPTVFLAQVEGRMHDLQGVLDAAHC